MKTDTPETDADRSDVDTYAGKYLCKKNPKGEWVHYLTAKKLERERDEARSALRTALGVISYSDTTYAVKDGYWSHEESQRLASILPENVIGQARRGQAQI